MRVLLVAVLAAAVGVAPAASGSKPACRGGDLAATFSLIPGSPGAGNVVYALRLRNRSGAACFVSGLPRLQLLDHSGRRLPTHVAAENPGALTAVRVVLKPGGYASASARFSPDVPGPGEQTKGPCEPKAYKIRIGAPPGTGMTVGPVSPPTAVCEHGGMNVSALVAGRTPPHA